MKEKITSWLESGKKWEEGVFLYGIYGHSASQKRIFNLGGPTKKNQECLEYELRKLLKSASPNSNQEDPVAGRPVPAARIGEKKNSVRGSSPRSKSKPKGKKGKTPRKSKPSKKK